MKIWLKSKIQKTRNIGPQQIRIVAFAVTLPLCALAIVTLFHPKAKKWVAHGPIQSGHADIDCSGCHTKSPGSTRQQIQANLSFALGLRDSFVDFGHAAVNSQLCLNCHERPNEHHPIYRFNEPRFADVLPVVEANSCLGCHSEHENQRSFVAISFCSNCHEDLTLKNDPVDVPHVTLVAEENWGSCMGCHDFHGNYERATQNKLTDAYDSQAIRDYLEAGKSPYGAEKLFQGKEK